MKKIAFTIALLAFSFVAFAQSNKVVISGKLQQSMQDNNNLSNRVSISYLRNYCSTNPSNKIVFYTAIDTSSDSFFISFTLDNARFLELQMDNYSIRLFLAPGDSIHADMDLNNNSINYSGRGSEINNFLAKTYFNKASVTYKFSSIRKKYRKIAPLDFYSICDSLYKAWEVEYKHSPFLASLGNVSDFIRNEMVYEIANEQYNYLKIHFKERMMAGESIGPDSSYYWFLGGVKTPTPIGMDASYFNDLKKDLAVMVNNPDAINSLNYFRFLDNYVNDLMPEYFADKHFKEKGLENLYLHQYKLAKAHFSGKVLEVLTGRILVNSFATQTESTSLMDSLMSDYLNATKDTSCLNTVKEKYHAYLTLVKGAPAPDFTFVNQHGKEKSLAAMKGKIIYMVVLSSFNIPSLNVMNALATLQNHYSARTVAILYVSLDTKNDEWEKNVKLFHIEGEQWLPALTNQQDKFSDLYNIRNLPQCILIDKEGKIISTNAPNPNQGIETEIDNLLK